MNDNTHVTPEIDLISIITNQPTLQRKKGTSSLKGSADQAVAKAQAASGSDPLLLGKLKSVKVADIVIEDRPRQDMGDLKGLARSMAEVGHVQPVLLDAQMRLVAGHRRVEAARGLGWKEVPARILDVEDPLALTIAEDANRKPLTASEKHAVCGALKRRAKDGEAVRDYVAELVRKEEARQAFDLADEGRSYCYKDCK